MKNVLYAGWVVTLAFAGPALADVQWEASLAGALERAEAEGKVVFLAVNMDGERANDFMTQIYREKSVAVLSQSTVNLVASRFDHASGEGPCKRFGTVTCADHQEVEKDMRKSVVKPDAKGHVVAPQHVFLAPNGDVLLSATYAIDLGELRWCFVTAVRQVDPEAAPPMPDGARAPRRLVMSGVLEAEGPRPFGEKELAEVIKDMRSGFGAVERRESFERILATDHPDAVDYAAKELATGFLSYSPQARVRTLRDIARTSPASFWEAVSPFLESDSEAMRGEAAAALEQLGARKSVKVLRTALRKEKSERVQKNILRALGTAGAEDANARKLLVKYAQSDKQPLLQRNALLALGAHAGEKSVDRVFGEALASADAARRQAVALALAFARRTDLRAKVAAAAANESDAEAKAVMERALLVLDGANLHVIAEDVRAVGNDSVWRPRFFGEKGD